MIKENVIHMTKGRLFMSITSILLEVLFVLNILLAATIIFLERRNPSTTWAWLMVLIFLPILGFIIYLIFGQNMTKRKMFDWPGREKIGITERVREQITNIKNGTFPFKTPKIAYLKDHIYMQLVNNDALLTQHNDITLYTDGRQKFDALLKDIKEATDHIHVQYYIFRNDSLGTRIIHALTQKAQQGLDVRVLYDHMGSRKLKQAFFKDFLEAGGHIGAFFPLSLQLPQSPQTRQHRWQHRLCRRLQCR